MSMTRGPIVPPSTGSSTDFPLLLSVNVIVPVTTLFPSIAPPLSLRPQAAAGFRPENRPLAPDWQTRASGGRRRARDIGNSRQALLAPEHLHHLEDTRRGQRAGQRGAQRLGDGTELCSFFVDKGA